jgi:hypothetical protein
MVRERLVDDRLLDDQVRLGERGVDVTLGPLDRRADRLGRAVGRRARPTRVRELAALDCGRSNTGYWA